MSCLKWGMTSLRATSTYMRKSTWPGASGNSESSSRPPSAKRSHRAVAPSSHLREALRFSKAAGKPAAQQLLGPLIESVSGAS